MRSGEMAIDPASEPTIFVVGSGRSGTTLLYRILTGHPDLSWLSNASNRIPWFPALATISRLPLAQRARAFQPANEGIHGYRYCGIDSKRLTEKRSPLNADDVSSHTRSALPTYIDAHRRAMRRPGFVSKNTANSMRIAVLSDLFPNARFVHCLRHPYGVVNSLLQVDFWPDLNLWWCGKSPNQLEAEGEDRHAIAAQHWRHQVEAVLASAPTVDADRWHRLKYEDLLDDPEARINALLGFCGLQEHPDVGAGVERLGLRPERQGTWRSTLSDEALAAIDQVVSRDLAHQLEYRLATD